MHISICECVRVHVRPYVSCAHCVCILMCASVFACMYDAYVSVHWHVVVILCPGPPPVSGASVFCPGCFLSPFFLRSQGPWGTSPAAQSP